MPSHLTRVVFRQLLANEPIASTQCLRRSIRPQYVLPRPRLRPTQRRHFFNMFGAPPPREAVRPNLAPGLETLIHYSKMKRLNARLPSPEATADAIAKFIKNKRNNGRPINDTEALYLLQALQYVQSHAADHFTTTALTKFLHVLYNNAIKSSTAHRDLALALYHAYCNHPNRADAVPVHKCLQVLVRVLSMLGHPSLARDILTDKRSEFAITYPAGNPTPTSQSLLWIPILQAFADQGDALELQKTLDLMEQYGASHTLPTMKIMIEHSAAQNQVEIAKKWYHQFLDELDRTPEQQSELLAEVQQALLRMSVRQRDFDYGQSIIKDMMTANPSKLQWDLIFEFAAGTGKGVDEIDRMMAVMEKTNHIPADGQESCLPDVETINRLVEFAISKRDPYMAERFITMGRKRGIEPNARTLVMQIDYRLSVDDVDGALTAYKDLQAQDTTDNKDLPAVNRLITSMCTSRRHDFDTIMNVAADLSDRRARFEPPTVCALTLLHISREELEDVEDLLNTHCFSFSHDERATVIATLLNVCTDANTPTTTAWETYNIIKKTFDELPREPRETLMLDFFRRERPDMAVHVFTHMRTHNRSDTQPTSTTYISVLRGIASFADTEALDAVHNQLKLDYTIEPDTRLLNALMLAFTACEQPRRALTFWDEIVASREGPTISSIHLAFRACELSPWGDEKAREIWTRLSRTGLELDEKLWASYLAALVGNGDVEGTVATFEKAVEEGRVEATGFIIASIHNVAPGKHKKADVISWATARYPLLWAECEKKYGLQKGENGQRYFGVNRAVEL